MNGNGLPANIVEWTVRSLGRGTRVTAATRLTGVPCSAYPPWLVRVDTGGPVTEVVLRTVAVGPVRHPGFAREVQALTLAEQHRVRAPQVIAADVDGSEAGDPVFLVTALPGSSRQPGEPSAARLRAYGAAAASLRRVRAEPGGDLRLSAEGIDVYGAAAERRRMVRYLDAGPDERAAILDAVRAETGCDPRQAHERIVNPSGGRSALLEAAERHLATLPVPEGPTVLVHGDLHLGNTLWVHDRLTGLIDWDAARVGHEAIDLGNTRVDATLRYGPPAAEHVLSGWQDAAGHTLEPEVLAYWDTRAVLNVPAVLPRHLRDREHTARRDAFLRTALRRLPGWTENLLG